MKIGAVLLLEDTQNSDARYEATVYFPTTKEEFDETLKLAGVEDIGKISKIMVKTTYLDKEYMGFDDYISGKSDVNELNNFAAKFTALDDDSIEKLLAVVESGRYMRDKGVGCDDLGDIINIIENLNTFTFYPGFDAQDYGEFLLTGPDNMIDKLKSELNSSTRDIDAEFADIVGRLYECADVEQYGRLMSYNNDGDFLERGYLIEDGGYQSVYYGVLDTPEEYRLWGLDETPENALASVRDTANASVTRLKDDLMESELYIDGCKVLHSLKLDGFDHVIAEKIEGTYVQYRLYQGTSDNALGISEYSIVYENSDYLATMQEFVRCLGVRLDSIDLDRRYRGNPDFEDAPILRADCVPDGMKESIEGKVVAIKPEVFAPEYRTCSHQLYIATGGFGTSPDARGRTVFATNIYSGEKERFKRDDILGVVLPERIPAWVHEKLGHDKVADESSIGRLLTDTKEQPQQYESVIAKIEEGKHQKSNCQKGRYSKPQNHSKGKAQEHKNKNALNI